MRFHYQFHPDGRLTWHEGSLSPSVRPPEAPAHANPHPKAPLVEQQARAFDAIMQKHLAGRISADETRVEHQRMRDQFEAARDAMYPGWRERYEHEVAAWIERRP